MIFNKEEKFEVSIHDLQHKLGPHATGSFAVHIKSLGEKKSESKQPLIILALGLCLLVRSWTLVCIRFGFLVRDTCLFAITMMSSA